ncbi:MAG: tRNA lysidine(34) synthetase TilS [Actinomycetota bacterium]
MHKFVRNFLTEWRKLGLPFENASFIAAISGGADSLSLLLVLNELRERKKLQNRFVAAHFNHNLRGEASRKDAEFVRALSEKLDFEFVGEISDDQYQISKKGNLEQNARVARYEFLTETAQSYKAFGILTAHTINDQAETFLLNLIRGSGISGLSGMKVLNSKFQVSSSKFKEKSQISLIRPLLSWARRDDTENFCRENEIEFRNDAMNEDLGLKRVRVRKILLPMLEDFNPKIIETLAKTANLLQTESDILMELKDQKPNTKDPYLFLKDLKTLSKSAVYQVLRNWLKTNRDNLRQLELKHIEAIASLIVSRKSGKMVELPNDEIIVKKEGKIFFQKRKVEKSGSAN